MKKILAVALVAIMAVTAMMLVACAPNVSNVTDKLEEEGYKVLSDKDGKDDVEGAKCVLFATKLLNSLTIYECENSGAAKEAAEKMNDNSIFKAVIIKQMGNTVVVGTEQAFEDAGL